MGSKAKEAADFHRSGYSCSQAVYCAFCDETGLTEAQARSVAAPYAGGAKIKCGAVLAAELVLDEKEELVRQFEERFTAKNQSVNCRELRRGLRSCRGCVEDSAQILEEMLNERKAV